MKSREPLTHLFSEITCCNLHIDQPSLVANTRVKQNASANAHSHDIKKNRYVGIWGSDYDGVGRLFCNVATSVSWSLTLVRQTTSSSLEKITVRLCSFSANLSFFHSSRRKPVRRRLFSSFERNVFQSRGTFVIGPLTFDPLYIVGKIGIGKKINAGRPWQLLHNTFCEFPKSAWDSYHSL